MMGYAYCTDKLESLAGDRELLQEERELLSATVNYIAALESALATERAARERVEAERDAAYLGGFKDGVKAAQDQIAHKIAQMEAANLPAASGAKGGEG
jgi:hypothetical protein